MCHVPCFVAHASGIMVKQGKDLRRDYITLLVRQMAMINGIMNNSQKPWTLLVNRII